MHDAGAWLHPHIIWEPTLDVERLRHELRERGSLLATWPATEFDATDTDCFTLGEDFWVLQPDVGAVRFRLDTPSLTALPWPNADDSWFRQVVTRSWLPALYPLWGRQVLHASAVLCAVSDAAVAFTGPTHSGKSTTAFGLRRKPGWTALCDDTVAFSVARADGGTRIHLHPLPNEARLRPASAEFYGLPADSASETLTWPSGTPTLRAVYVLEGDEHSRAVAEFTRLRTTDGLPLLLQQAYALSLELPKYNQQLMKDYLALAAGVPLFRLRYRRSFDVADELFAAIEAHLAAVAGVACTPGVPVGDRG